MSLALNSHGRLEGEDFMDRRQDIRDATDEFSVQEVLDMLEVAARARQSFPSIAPVGMDVDVEPFDLTHEAHLAVRRRKLSRFVTATVGVACAILAASVIKRTAFADHVAASQTLPAQDPPTVTTPRASISTNRVPTFERQPEATVSGLVQFATRPGWAWLDGHQLTATSAIVPCGTHQVQIGGEEQHDVDVPCGGEVVVRR